MNEAVSAMRASPRARCAAFSKKVESTPAENATNNAIRLAQDAGLVFRTLRPSFIAEQIGAQIMFAFIGKNRYDDMPLAQATLPLSARRNMRRRRRCRQAALLRPQAAAHKALLLHR